MVQLRTGHLRLRQHMFTKFRIGECHCGTSPMTVEHFLQDCQTHQNVRSETWPADTPVREKIYGPVENLQHTVAYVRAAGVPVWVNDEEEEETWHCNLIAIFRTIFIKLWHSNLAWRWKRWHVTHILISMTLTLMQGHSGLAEETIQRWIISTTRQTIIVLGKKLCFTWLWLWNHLYGLTILLSPFTLTGCQSVLFYCFTADFQVQVSSLESFNYQCPRS